MLTNNQINYFSVNPFLDNDLFETLYNERNKKY